LVPAAIVVTKRSAKLTRLLGAHLSTSGGWEKLLQRAQTLGCRSVQIFASNPRGWTGTLITPASGNIYRSLAPRYGVEALVVHAIYLVNLASPNPVTAARSFKSVVSDLKAARYLGAKALVMHPGSDTGAGGGEERLLRALVRLRAHVAPGMRILLEGMASPPGRLGHLATLGRMVRRAGAHVGVCLDSAHLCAAGYHLADGADFKRFDRDVKRWIGYSWIGCLHCNDSRQPCGSHRDQHENLGEGFVGRAGLVRILAHPAVQKVPVILETPGFDNLGPDLKNMQRLRKYADLAP
jgi:deoxyribonuclease-4